MKKHIILVTILCMLSCALGALIVKIDSTSRPVAAPPPISSTPAPALPSIQDMPTLELQTFLREKGYKGKDGYKLTLDGRMGINTEFARDRYIGDCHAGETFNLFGEVE